MDFIKTIVKADGLYKVVDGVPFYLVSDAIWNDITNGKEQVSQSYNFGEKSFVLMKEVYFWDNCFFWIEHEVGHCKYYFSHPIVKISKNYPDNEVERFAFKYQFDSMKKKGYNDFNCFEIIQSAYIDSSGWNAEKESFFRQFLNCKV